ncbi:hypothetical protein DM01DRAFT_1325015 [Hesseltinella vesiculosa]|uniref:NEDD8-activating enzyme E1 regulatory subunit n=1 Tax=Hesseltinella vesiculosa TaxID=101127 RepID=A0A1X2GCH7_9FUNG|nr:hypothetical protein DM01DRAFT_1325015 [Hesseltinella vesiculosa]
MSFNSQPSIDLKTQKYDRQLRLWAASGQTALENANICLLHASATGCEILKNLILPGIGSVTVVDDKIVDERDLASNFFLEPGHVGTNKAEAVTSLLTSLNEDVAASHRSEAPHALINATPQFFDAFDVILAMDLSDEDLIKLSDFCETNSKILISVYCKGLCGMFRIQAPEHTVIESHPENAVDLRLTQPMDELAAYAASFDLDAMDQTDHGHVPFVVILLQFVEKWKKEHDGKPPKSYSERNELKAQIRAAMRTPDEENFEEALAQLWRLASSNELSSDIRKIFEHPSCDVLTPDSTPFWFAARGVREFVNNQGQGQLPLAGKLPDMKSDTKNYVELQLVYRDKARRDLQTVMEHVHRLLQEVGVSENYVPMEMIELFCKNAAFAKLLNYRSITDEYTSPNTKAIADGLAMDENMAYYLVFRAASRFYAKYKRYPVGSGSDAGGDISRFKDFVSEWLESIGLEVDMETLAKPVTNYVYFKNKEVANLGALVGGLVAQEAIKMITHQYIPINNTCVFNGIASTSSVFEL